MLETTGPFPHSPLKPSDPQNLPNPPSPDSRGLVINYLFENEFNLHVNENLSSYERINTKTRFQKEVKGVSEMGYFFNYLFDCHVGSCNIFITYF